MPADQVAFKMYEPQSMKSLACLRGLINRASTFALKLYCLHPHHYNQVSWVRANTSRDTVKKKVNVDVDTL